MELRSYGGTGRSCGVSDKIVDVQTQGKRRGFNLCVAPSLQNPEVSFISEGQRFGVARSTGRSFGVRSAEHDRGLRE